MAKESWSVRQVCVEANWPLPLVTPRPGPAELPGFAMDFEAALSRLPDGARQVFVLYDVEGYSHDEIAQAMGISTGTSKSQLHRARMLLRNHLN